MMEVTESYYITTDCYVACKCGEALKILKTEACPGPATIWLTVSRCKNCKKTNYEAGEADAKQE